MGKTLSMFRISEKIIIAVFTSLLIGSCLNPRNDTNRISREKTNSNSEEIKNKDKDDKPQDNKDKSDETTEEIGSDEEDEPKIPIDGIKDVLDSIENNDEEDDENKNEASLASDTMQEIDPEVWEHPNTKGYKLTALQLYLPNKYYHDSELNLHFFATSGTSPKKFDATVQVFKKAIDLLKPENKDSFSGHHIFLITFNEPDVPGAGVKGHKNTGGDGFVVITEELICADSVYDTIRPDDELTDTVWRTPLHELGHSIELTLGISSKTSELLKLNHPNDPSDVEFREKFAWLTESWFNQGLYTDRNNMQDWEKSYFQELFTNQDFNPSCSF